MEECLFCNLKNKKEIKYVENEFAYGVFDENPVSLGHTIIMPKRHSENVFETTDKERKAIFDLIQEARKIIDEKYKPTGYNVGANCGISAGQSIMHTHIHLIPRYDGDVKNPRGGVRGVIPEKRDYNAGN